MILMLLTSHRADCFAICLDCLERYTDLTRFSRMYIIANEPAPAHKAMVFDFASRNPNTIIVEVIPRGLEAVMRAEDYIFLKNRKNIFVKLDEDVFVTEGWLDGLVNTYEQKKNEGCLLVSALILNNAMGRQMLQKAFTAHYREFAELDALKAQPISQNAAYAVWVWRNILSGRMRLTPTALLRNLTEERVSQYLNINCILFDARMVQAIYPLEDDMDESKINTILASFSELYGLVTPRSIAHHYSFGPQQAMVDAHISLADIRAHLLPATPGSCSLTSPK